MTPPDRRTPVAVLVACHNDAATLRETLASLRMEAGIELVVVDDGSTDPATHQELARAEKEGIRVLRKANAGPASAWMAGVHATTAPYVMPFSSDDVLLPGATHLLANALDSHPEASFAWGDVETFGLASGYRPSVPTLCPWLVTYANCIPAYSLFRRTVLLEVGGWEYVNAQEDWDLWMRLAAYGACGIHVPRSIYLYRRVSGGRFRGLGRGHKHFYGELRSRNAGLFKARPANRVVSPAPLPVKLLLPFIDAFPGLPRLTKTQLSEAVTLLFWSAGLRRTGQIMTQGLLFRARLLLGGDTGQHTSG
jgi:glycosyltransferase involved in cell wall biosynthesis